MLAIVWDGKQVVATDIRSTRRAAAQVLSGKTCAEVLQTVPLLFSVCGRAQGAAAAAALAAAQQEEVAAAGELQRRIIAETMQEHLWRFMLDWPQVLGLPQQGQRFAAWYAMLRKIGAGEADMQVFLHEFERDALGMAASAWRREMTSYSALQEWWRNSSSPLALMLAKLDEQELHGSHADAMRLLPSWSAAEALRECAHEWDEDFSVHPQWQGAAAETGARAYHADAPLLHDVRQQGRTAALLRLLARVLDTVELACGDTALRLDAASAAEGEGVALVRTARGMLMHRVRLVADKVADYAIVAPTEWNFHPAGAFAQDMRGVKASNAQHVRQYAQIAALSLDPCVPYEIEVREHA